MSLLLGLTSSQLGHVVPDVELPISTYVDLLESVGGPTGHWRMNEISGVCRGGSGRSERRQLRRLPPLGFDAIVLNSDGGAGRLGCSSTTRIGGRRREVHVRRRGNLRQLGRCGPLSLGPDEHSFPSLFVWQYDTGGNTTLVPETYLRNIC